MKRVVWFALGAGVGVYALIKVRGYVAKANPQALAGSASTKAKDALTGFTEGARDFVDGVRAAMAEREAELRDATGLPQQP